MGKLLSGLNLGRLLIGAVNDQGRNLNVGKIEGCRGQAEMGGWQALKDD